METKHASFTEADAARAKWLNNNPAAQPEITHRVRVKRRPNGQYSLIVRAKQVQS